MGLANYSELQTAIATFMERTGDTDVTNNIEDCITLGEAQINRVIENLSLETSLSATASSRSIDISSLNVVEPISLWRTDEDGEDTPIELKNLGSLKQSDVAGDPYAAALDADSLEFDKPLTSGQTFRFVYRGRVALSDSNTTNDILTNHPDVYLAAAIFWGGLLTQDNEMAASYKAVFDQFSRQTRSTIAQQRRSTLTPVAGLIQGRRNRGSYAG